MAANNYAWSHALDGGEFSICGTRRARRYSIFEHRHISQSREKEEIWVWKKVSQHSHDICTLYTPRYSNITHPTCVYLHYHAPDRICNLHFSRFAYQRLKGWRPILCAHNAEIFFLSVGTLLLALGIPILVASLGVREYSVRYDDAGPMAGLTHEQQEEAIWTAPKSGIVYNLTINVDERMEPPVRTIFTIIIVYFKNYFSIFFTAPCLCLFLSLPCIVFNHFFAPLRICRSSWFMNWANFIKIIVAMFVVLIQIKCTRTANLFLVLVPVLPIVTEPPPTKQTLLYQITELLYPAGRSHILSSTIATLWRWADLESPLMYVFFFILSN